MKKSLFGDLREPENHFNAATPIAFTVDFLLTLFFSGSPIQFVFRLIGLWFVAYVGIVFYLRIKRRGDCSAPR